MSLWSRDEHRIVLYQDQVVLVSIRRELTRHGMSRQVLGKEIFSCNAAAGDMPWDDALRTLETALLSGEHRKSHATAVISNQFMRYALIPRNEALSDDREEMIFARHSFKEMYGDDVDSWELRISHHSTGMMQMACAMDARLLGALRALFGRLKISLQSIQPHLMMAYNSCHTVLHDRSAWLVLAERGNLCFALLQDGQWSWVRTVRGGENWHEDLPVFLEREAFLANTGIATSDVFVWAPGHQDEPLPSGSPWQFQHLQPQPIPGLASECDKQFAMYANGWPQ